VGGQSSCGFGENSWLDAEAEFELAAVIQPFKVIA
jgi:hypothetical protein